MAEYRCKMCGGELNPADGESIVVCEYCGVMNVIKYHKLPDIETPSVKKNKIPIVIACTIAIAVVIAGIFSVEHFAKKQKISELDAMALSSTYSISSGLNEKSTSTITTTRVTSTEPAKEFDVGDTVYFGNYEQDNDYSNGSEKIEWIVLDVRDNKALIITKNGIDSVAYNNQYVSTTWENCSLRKWLNNNFYNTAFSSSEREQIQLTKIKNNDNREYKTNGGVDTEDKIFALSISEAEMYFSSDDSRSCLPTDYALANGASENTYEELIEIGDTPAVASKYAGHCWWWLRSPGCKNDNASYIFADGEIGDYGRNVNRNYVCVRPAMWIEIN